MQFSRNTFLWYDLETYGLNPRYDRIAQFAAQRTDMNLNPVGPAVILYGKVSDDYLPDPLACLITGITPEDHPEALSEYELALRINEEFSEPYTVVCGFNNIRFDDEMVRSLLYRNLLDPYEREWKDGCSRWDILDLVRAAYDFRPAGIEWPVKNKDTGNPVFKLTELTQANHIDQTGAHDAMVDVNATIAIARLIKEKQPKLFSYAFKNRTKEAVKNKIQTPMGTPILYTASQFTNPNGCTAMVMPITPSVEQGNTIFCFDLSKDPTQLLSAPPEKIPQCEGFCKIATNRCPFVTQINLNFPGAEALVKMGIDWGECFHRYQMLRNEDSLIPKLRSLASDDEFQAVNDTDFQIYNGFFSNDDKGQFDVIHNTKPEDMLGLNIKFSDVRIPEMLFRHVCRNWPEKLTAVQQQKWKSFCANRLLNPPGNVKVNWDFFNRKIDENLQSKNIEPKQKAVMMKLKKYGEEVYGRVFS